MKLAGLSRVPNSFVSVAARSSTLDIVVPSEFPQDGRDPGLPGATGGDRHHQGIRSIIRVCYRDSVQVQEAQRTHYRARRSRVVENRALILSSDARNYSSV